MLTKEQLQKITATIDDALQASTNEPSLLRHLLQMARLEAYQRAHARQGRLKKAA